MTSPAEPPPTDPTPASQATRPLRELAAVVLLGANAVLLFVGLIQLLSPQGPYSTVTNRAGGASFTFIGLVPIVLPLLAVLLATHVAPVVPKAKLITKVALGEYAVSALLGGLTLLVWLVGQLAEAQLFDAFTGLLTRVAWIALFAVAAYLVWSVWQRLYHVPQPKPEPGLYGSPQPGWSHQGNPGYAGQPGGGWSPPGQPSGWPESSQTGYTGAGQPGYAGAGQPGYAGAGQPGYTGAGQPGGYGDAGQPGWPVAGQQPVAGQPPSAGGQPSAGGPPSSPHTWPPHGQPAVPPQSTAPSAPSQSTGPQSESAGASAPPVSPSAPPFGQPASADPTQTIPRQGADAAQPVPPADDAEADRTQRIDPS